MRQKTKKETQKELAFKLGVTPIYLNSVLRHRRRPSIVFAILLERVSDGKYRARDFRPELNGIK